MAMQKVMNAVSKVEAKKRMSSEAMHRLKDHNSEAIILVGIIIEEVAIAIVAMQLAAIVIKVKQKSSVLSFYSS